MYRGIESVNILTIIIIIRKKHLKGQIKMYGVPGPRPFLGKKRGEEIFFEKKSGFENKKGCKVTSKVKPEDNFYSHFCHY